MTLQQLEYILAVYKTGHFMKAAELCQVTQPTLSAMIQKLEEELDCKIFDRSQHPIQATEMGEKIIRQAQIILYQANQLKEMLLKEKESVSGNLNLAIIPTIASYLLPRFIALFRNDYPDVSLKITEMRTETIIQKLKTAEIDMAILATPLNMPDLLEIPIYYEKFIAYISPGESIYELKELSANNLPLEHLWVLEEGHCFRNQIFNFCDQMKVHNYMYEAGSIETLVKIVDINGGYTVIPELHVDSLTQEQKKNLRNIVQPEATREISIVIRDDYVREGLLNAVADSLKKIIPPHMLDSRLKKFAIKI
ncbi:MAG TPA: LysR substrate-binding domain-containing protein [Paludibacteraceae bacterium]|jgi:LysR family hydrogen peroxide-inducible transcriptional activator|nr:LysR family transcriptional regulator [Paludibacteraceae bacterium]MBP9017228.1 LysR family transcriptional regulator [Paludibacteraceae bacterium]HNZ61651.1 LysR substrate-binding domain-containing protein [Paludibacteraceae bacterium]HOH55185.1 LysR substrate-binding domain-containing protein [Paludibacteraceae bacterium]